MIGGSLTNAILHCRRTLRGRICRPWDKASSLSISTSDRVRKLADTLADYLGRISGAKFDVLGGDGSSGIVVGTLADFDNLPIAETPRPGTPAPHTVKSNFLSVNLDS